MPPPDTRIKVGQHVHVLVSLGPPKVKIPNVVGSSSRAAQIAAIQRELTVGDIVEIHRPGAQADRVLAQEPPASASEIHSPALNLLVSLGAPSPAYECPNFVGHTLGEARSVLGLDPIEGGDEPMFLTAQGPVLLHDALAQRVKASKSATRD